MAEISIFNKKAVDTLHNPEDLDKYVRVTSTSVWLVILACIVLLAGMFTWACLGTVSSGITTTGMKVDEAVICYVDPTSIDRFEVGSLARVNETEMTVSSIGSIPLSRDEARETLDSDYLTSTLMTSDWGYRVELSGENDFSEYTPLNVYITSEQIPPISLVFGNN